MKNVSGVQKKKKKKKKKNNMAIAAMSVNGGVNT